jgi:hypothetical protein
MTNKLQVNYVGEQEGEETIEKTFKMSNISFKFVIPPVEIDLIDIIF